MEGLVFGCGLAFCEEGSVLQRAGGLCQGRSHSRSQRRCQAGPEPLAAASYPRTKESSMGDQGLREDRAARNAGKSS